MPKYSNSPEVEEYVGSLVDKGWHYELGGKHGKLFTPDRKLRASISRTPSDWRTVMNIIRDCKRLERGLRTGVVEVDHIPKVQTIKLGPQWTQPAPAAVEEPVEKPVEKVAVPRIVPKQLDNLAFELISAGLDAGKSYPSMVGDLRKMGYVAPRGGELQNFAIARFMRERGTELGKGRGIKKPKPLPVVAAPPVVQKIEHPFLTEVMEIVSSNLSDAAKEKMLVFVGKQFFGEPK